MRAKKLLALFLAISMLCLCACADTSVTDTPPTETAANQDATNAAPVETEAGDSTSGGVSKIDADYFANKDYTDLLGRELNITPGSYQRVVCIGAGALRMYSYVGDVALLCGVEDIDNTTLEERPKMFDNVARPYVMAYGDVFNTLPSCGVGGPMAQSAEAEKILACNPDIVISEFEDVAKSDALQEQLGVPVVTLKSGKDGVFDECFFQSLALLGRIFGREDTARRLISFVKTERADIETRVGNAQDDARPRAYICGLGNWGTTDHLMTAQEYLPFKIAGVNNAVNDLANPGIGPIEEEKFIELGMGMDMMIIDAAAVKNIKPLYQEDPSMFENCKAWKEGRVYLEMAYNAYYTNYEIALLNTWYIATLAYPDLFSDIDITQKANEITRVFLGAELAEEIFACPESFGGYQQVDPEKLFK